MTNELQATPLNILDKELIDHDLRPIVKDDETPVTVKDVILAALSVSDANHEDKMGRWEAIKSIKEGLLKEEHKEITKKWILKTVASPVVCGQILDCI